MKVDEFRKYWIKNFPISEVKKYQHAIEMQNDPLLVIKEFAFNVNDVEMKGFYSLHYSGREFLDNFWNTLLELKPVEKSAKTKKRTIRKTNNVTKKRVAAKKTITKKRVAKKSTPKKKVTTKKRAVRKKAPVKKADLLTF